MSAKSVTLLVLLCSLFQLSFTSGPAPNQTINAITGDVSFVDTFGRLPDSEDSEILRITTHLEYVTFLLESADISHLTNSQLENRRHLISLLKIYTEENPFPKNYTYEHERRPVFIDKHGNICAVGFLVQQTAGQEAAEAINAEYKYGYVLEMDSELLDNWLNEYGLTKKEAAMIQPAYGPPPTATEETVNHLETGYIVSSGSLTSIQLAFSSISFLKSNSDKTNAQLSFVSAGFGALSVVNGMYHLYRSEERVFSGFTTREVTNEYKRNLSIANMAFGTASIVINVYRGIKLNQRGEAQAFTFIPSVQHIPGLTNPIPTASLALRF